MIDPPAHDAAAIAEIAAFDPSHMLYRSQGYSMFTMETGRDGDGAPMNEVWAFAGEDDPSEGYGWLDLRVHEIITTQKSGTIAVYYRQWFAPDGQPAFGAKAKRQVGSLASLKALIRRRKMTPARASLAQSKGEE